MEHCQWAFPIGRDDACGCRHEKIVHKIPRTAKYTTCEKCPFRSKYVGMDFFQATTSLLVQKQRSGEYRPKPRKCGGCNKAKPAAEPQQTLHFVWPYWHRGAAGDELRWSIRSVQEFFHGHAKITIVGDRPPWFNGHVLRRRRVKSGSARSFRDMVRKMHVIAGHGEIDERFVWMMDDIYFLRPFTIADLEVPRAYRWRGSTKNTWQQLKANTMSVLRQHGFPNHDYATHMPHLAERSKLRELIQRYKYGEEILLWEVLYGNIFRGIPQRTRPFFWRINRPLPIEEYARQSAAATVMNHTSSAWCPELQSFLADLLPNPFPLENDVFRPPARGKLARKPIRMF